MNNMNNKKTNIEWCLEKGIELSNLRTRQRKMKYGGGFDIVDCTTNKKLGTIDSKASYVCGMQTNGWQKLIEWLSLEHKSYIDSENILTDEERGYLKQVIKPFRKQIKYISKGTSYIETNKYFILFKMKNKNDFAYLPNFSTDSKYYKGMKEETDYTLKELGL